MLSQALVSMELLIKGGPKEQRIFGKGLIMSQAKWF
jgi:hypothetical protein